MTLFGAGTPMRNCRFIEVAAGCCDGRARLQQMKESITAEPAPTSAQPQIKFARISGHLRPT